MEQISEAVANLDGKDGSRCLRIDNLKMDDGNWKRYHFYGTPRRLPGDMDIITTSGTGASRFHDEFVIKRMTYRPNTEKSGKAYEQASD